MHVGHRSGCHQIPERSFLMWGYQFPVCARCAGAYIGEFASVVSLFFGYRLSNLFAGGFVAIMLADWLIQRLGIRESSNPRRVITGLLCGFAIVHLGFSIIVHFFRID
ncbi:MAG: DUF2085 domain-containing protein [Verrucomicrobia bacterium]|nr:DUF2085 domain-containing protein [Verrucomicrobiota bacterium]